MHIGDLVQVKSNSGDDVGKIYGIGIYLGVKTTWKDWRMVHLIQPWQLSRSGFKGSPFDEPYWLLEVISPPPTENG